MPYGRNDSDRTGVREFAIVKERRFRTRWVIREAYAKGGTKTNDRACLMQKETRVRVNNGLLVSSSEVNAIVY
jgi:hypothetical protein